MSRSSSSFTSSFSSSSYVSFSSSSSSSSGGQSSGHHYIQQSASDGHGTTTRTVSQRLGEPVVEETRHYDNQGRQLLSAPAASSMNQNQNRIQDIEVEDVTDQVDADKRYTDTMQDEYAKREGGA